MELYNLKKNEQRVTFAQAVKLGLGDNQGLFFPSHIPTLGNIDELLAKDFVSRSVDILDAFLGDELGSDTVESMVRSAFNFPLAVEKVKDQTYALELTHGPTLAFKDFGARFLAQCLNHLCKDEKATILTATSGDTGAAVAHAFYGLDNINVAVLYPKGKISVLQEKLFCTLGKNIHTYAVTGRFDDCQQLVKDAFDDLELKEAISLNSANSINIARLLAQICYYFEAVAKVPASERKNLVVSVPSGNFGDLTAGMLAKALGLPIKRFIAATNLNDTVPRYLETGEWAPTPTVATRSNAMDVSAPNNWPRIEELLKTQFWDKSLITGVKVDEEQTVAGLKALYEEDYLCEPHGAIAAFALDNELKADETGIFLCTAHPSKFQESVEEILNIHVMLPKALADVADKEILSLDIDANFAQLRGHLMAI
ncbi:threonine synthase [Psychrobium sp. 1_MG-2023]|uniref:threonine synthase n=1 Tax=Psychrobium sp. 1_MG-2023 TaxID=3062624 RepID=UPI000C3279D5|nr:threonine synthase [Psychrobium sp. 1_MG-2023]MDP2559785.1 threonine synthase [Psychrobium sp. 1_MG-2023]PKF59107.1 threonine synthase [Alteromonadales bacterium alter-6D02]